MRAPTLLLFLLAGCITPGAADRARVVVSVQPGPASIRPDFGRASFDAAMATHGYTVTGGPYPFTPGFSQRPSGEPPTSGSVRVRIARGFAVEGFADFRESMWTVQTPANVAPSLGTLVNSVEFTVQPRGAAISYERARLRAGVGAVVASAHWRWKTLTSAEMMSEAQVTGGTLLVAYTQPVVGPVVAELRAQHHFGMQVGVPVFNNADRISLDGTFLALHVGVALF